jgi:hypothetical protein
MSEDERETRRAAKELVAAMQGVWDAHLRLAEAAATLAAKLDPGECIDIEPGTIGMRAYEAMGTLERGYQEMREAFTP